MDLPAEEFRLLDDLYWREFSYCDGEVTVVTVAFDHESGHSPNVALLVNGTRDAEGVLSDARLRQAEIAFQRLSDHETLETLEGARPGQQFGVTI